MNITSPCLSCGTPTTNGARCPECTAKYNRIRAAGTTTAPKTTARERGYDHRWRRLSERARRLQPFCTDCGATTGLQADHSPEAWERRKKGLPIRLQDIDVVCGPCNRKRGAARGQHARSRSKESKVPG